MLVWTTEKCWGWTMGISYIVTAGPEASLCTNHLQGAATLLTLVCMY